MSSEKLSQRRRRLIRTTAKLSVYLYFGAMAPSLSEQLKDAGFTLPPERLAAFQQSVDSATHLYLHGHATRSEVRAMRERILKAVCKEVTRVDES